MEIEEKDRRSISSNSVLSSSLLSPSDSNNPPQLMIPFDDSEVKGIIRHAIGISIDRRDNQSRAKIQNICDQITAEEFSSRLSAIQTSFLEKFVCRDRLGFSEGNDVEIAQNWYTLIAKLLPRSQGEITLYGDAIQQMADQLLEPDFKVNNYAISNSFALITDALELTENQIVNRIRAIQDNEKSLLPSRSNDRLIAVNSLLKFKTEEISKRATIMKQYQVGETGSWGPIPERDSDTLLVASRLSNADLELRLQSLNSLIKDKLTFDKSRVESRVRESELALRLQSLNSLIMYKSILNQQGYLFNKSQLYKAAFEIDSERFESRLSAIKKNIGFLCEANDYLPTLRTAFTISPYQLDERINIIKLFFHHPRLNDDSNMADMLTPRSGVILFFGRNIN
ncbi:MAG: hypothetical protein K2W92_09840 [Alphaproteobacteria bacterium]|nr:hypothetical protein [Alphaproteobacteria bacterium]